MTFSEGSDTRPPFDEPCVPHEQERGLALYPSHTARVGTLFVSVVMPVRNESNYIRETLDGLLAQGYPDDAFEIIVVDGESTDGTPAIVREYVAADSRVRLLHNPCRLSSAARNIGVKAAYGDVVVVVDGHCQFASADYIKNVADAFNRSQADCLGRPQSLEIDGGSALQRAIAVARASRLGHNPGSYIYSGEELFVPAHSVGVAYRKQVFDEIGYFDESFDACEDVEFNHRLDKAGLQCLLAPSITLRYHPRCSLKGLFRQLARYGTGRVRLARKHPDTLSLLTFAPAAFVAFLAMGVPLSMVWPLAGFGFLAIVAAYLAVVLGFSAGIAVREKRWSMLFYLPFVFPSIHFGAGYGEMREAFAGLLREDLSANRKREVVDAAEETVAAR